MDSREPVPTAVKLISDRLGHLPNEESRTAALQYKPRDTDVFVVGAAKTGTTWIQHIAHGLRSGGNMEFGEMSEVVPIIEYMHMFGKPDLYALQKYQPNMFKSHMLYSQVPKGNAKHLIIVRSPADAAVSWFHYVEDWLFQKGELSLHDFVDWWFVKSSPPYEINWSQRHMRFIAEAFPHRHDRGVLWLHYEDLKTNLKRCVKMISDFTGIGVGDQELLDLVEYQASFNFMKDHKHKFDSSYGRSKTREILGFKNDNEFQKIQSKVRKGEINEGKKEISPEQLQVLDGVWKELVEPVCGFASYEDMRRGINEELGRSF